MYTNEEIIKIMEEPMRSKNADAYKQIFKQTTGEDFRGCLCGDNFNRLFNINKNLANELKRQLETNQAPGIMGDQTEL